MKHKNYLTSLILLSAAVALVGCSMGRPGTRYSRSTGNYIDDKSTTSRVKSALGDDSLVKDTDIEVSTWRGNVHLTGLVDHPAQKERASQLTRNVKGVDWFKNDIIVKDQLPSEVQRSAAEQMNEPAGASRDPNYNQRQPQQRPSTPSSSAPMRSDTGWQKGSVNVYDPAAEISARPGSSFGSSGSESAFGAPGVASNDLTQRIQTQLRADNPQTAQRVRIETSANGTVILRGMVNSDSEKQSIESKVKAMQGVNRVDNQLEVRNQ